MLFYRALLRLYPKSFRAEYGAEMMKDFDREWRDASRGGEGRAPHPRRCRHTDQRRERARRDHEAGSALRHSIPAAHAGIHADRNCRGGTGDRRHHRDLLRRRSRAAAAAAVPRARPRRPALGRSLIARVSAHGTIAAELPRLAAHGHGVRAARTLHRWLGEPGGPRRAGTGQRRVRRRRSISDPAAAGGARSSTYGIRCQRRRRRTPDRDQRSNLANALWCQSRRPGPDHLARRSRVCDRRRDAAGFLFSLS